MRPVRRAPAQDVVLLLEELDSACSPGRRGSDPLPGWREPGDRGEPDHQGGFSSIASQRFRHEARYQVFAAIEASESLQTRITSRGTPLGSAFGMGHILPGSPHRRRSDVTYPCSSPLRTTAS